MRTHSKSHILDAVEPIYETFHMTNRSKTVARILTAVVIAWLPGFAMGGMSGAILPTVTKPNVASEKRAPHAKQIDLLTASDLEGGAVAEPTGASLRKRTVNSAMLTALETQEQIHRIELYLKSGPAQRGDLRVVQASK